MRELFNTQVSKEQLIDTLTAMAQSFRKTQHKDAESVRQDYYVTAKQLIEGAYGIALKGDNKTLKFHLTDDYDFDDRRLFVSESIDRVEALEGARWNQYYERADLEETA